MKKILGFQVDEVAAALWMSRMLEAKQINYQFIPTSLFRGRPLIRGFNENKLYHRLGPVQTSNFTCAESNVNERKQ